MSCMAVQGNTVAVGRGLDIDCFDSVAHKYCNIPSKPDFQQDFISDISISSDNKYLAIATSVSKQLIIYKLPELQKYANFTLARSASKIRFTPNNEQILVADKSGDAFIYDFNQESNGTKLLGHLSLLLDVLQTSHENFVITSDRDEKIRVSYYPNTYNIHAYCLGHREFVNHIEMLPHNDKFLTSSSGDGTIKIWDYVNGSLCYNIDAYLDVDDLELGTNFAKIMDEEGVDVTSLPIVHYSIDKLNDNTSILAVALHSFKKLLIYTLVSQNNQFTHKKEDMVTIDRFPAAMKINNKCLVIFDDVDCLISILSLINCNNKISFQLEKKIKMFEDKPINVDTKLSLETIKVLYKRKYDNVQEYQERKKQRLEKQSK